MPQGLDSEHEVHRGGKGVGAEIELGDRGPASEPLTGEFRVNPAVGDAEAGHLRPVEHIFQARAGAATEVEYASCTTVRDTGPQQIVQHLPMPQGLQLFCRVSLLDGPICGGAALCFRYRLWFAED